MKVRRLKRLVVKRETQKGILEFIGSMVWAANRLVKEIPTMKEYSRASSAILRNVERHRTEHFMKLMDIGLEEEDPAKSNRIIKVVKEIAEAYGEHRDTPLQKELLEHVKHVGKARDPEMILAFGEVAKHIRHIGRSNLGEEHAKIILEALALARTNADALKDLARKKYTEWMLALKEHLEKYRKGQKEDAIKGIMELITAQK